MDAAEVSFCSLCLLLFIGILLPGRSEAVCTIPSKIQGEWEVLDSTKTRVEATLQITSTGIKAVTFWNKTLDYTCYFQQGDYYLMNSGYTDLFDLYNVQIYFCWYLQKYDATTYRLYELTDRVLYTVEERAKAFLNGATPSVNDVCEIGFDTSLSFKQMHVRRSSAAILTPSQKTFFLIFCFAWILKKTMTE